MASGIPRTIHMIWLQGFDALPDNRRPLLDAWQTFCNEEGLTLCLWDEAQIERCIMSMPEHSEATLARFRQSQTFAQKSDIGRLAILYQQGGVYIDCDTLPLRSFTSATLDSDKIDLLLSGRFDLSNTERVFMGSFNNHVIGARPGHPLMQDLLSDFRRDDARSGTPFQATLRGFYLFSEGFMRYKDAPTTLVMASSQLDPINIKQSHYISNQQMVSLDVAELRSLFPSAYIVHFSTGMPGGEKWFDQTSGMAAQRAYGWISEFGLIWFIVMLILVVGVLLFLARGWAMQNPRFRQWVQDRGLRW